MFPYDKENLINYRFLLGWSAVLFVAWVLTGVLMQTYMGWAFAVMQAHAAAGPAIALFDWHPEPTAKRQLGAAAAVHVALGVGGYPFVNWASEALLAAVP